MVNKQRKRGAKGQKKSVNTQDSSPSADTAVGKEQQDKEVGRRELFSDNTFVLGRGNQSVNSESDTMAEAMAGCEEGEIMDSGDGSVLKAPVSNEDIMRELKSMAATMKGMKLSLEELKGEVFELKKENTELKKDIEKSKKREVALIRQVTEAKHQAKLAYQNVCELEQYGRRNNVRFFGVPESDRESPSACEKKVLRILNDKMGLRHIGGDQIEIAHRVGEKPVLSDAKPRPVIVRFVSRKTVSEVFQSRKQLKNTGYMVVEDLTKENYQLLMACRNHENCESAFSLRGKIFVKTRNGETKSVKAASDLDDNNLDITNGFGAFGGEFAWSSTPIHGTGGRGLDARGGSFPTRGRGFESHRGVGRGDYRGDYLRSEDFRRAFQLGEHRRPPLTGSANGKKGPIDGGMQKENVNVASTKL